ncbi:MAG: serine/threonine protein kinase [Cyanobium sp.]
MPNGGLVPGQLIGGRYRLERLLSEAVPPDQAAWSARQGELWLARDQLAAEAPCALRHLGPDLDQERARQLWTRLQAVLHPQVPRLGPALQEGDDLWLVRDWQAGRTYGHMLAARAERQMVFGAGEVLLLLRQLLPVLAALHSQELLHGDLSPDNLLRRDSDGLPVLLDFGLLRGTTGAAEPAAATPGYAPPALLRGEAAQPWMDLHALGVVALVLLSGDPPAALLDPVSLAWRWPVALDREPALRAQLQRLLEPRSAGRFATAAQALQAFQSLPMPESTGPVARADRTVALVPPSERPLSLRDPAPMAEAVAQNVAQEVAQDTAPAVAGGGHSGDGVPGGGPADEGSGSPPPGTAAADRAAADRATPEPGPAGAEIPEGAALPEAAVAPLQPLSPAALARRRDQEREEAAEGGLWPVLIALVLSAVVGTAIGWWWLGRDRTQTPPAGSEPELSRTLPADEVDQRRQLIDRLRALQINRNWFLRLVDAALLAQYPERRGRLPGDGPEDAPLRQVWNQEAEEWLARIQQLPLPLRQRLGSFSEGDWRQRQEGLVQQGIAPPVLQQLISASAQGLLPARSGEEIPAEPFRQLWYAAAEQVLDSLRIEPIRVGATLQTLAAEVPAGGARLFPIRLPAQHRLALGVSGTPLLQMSVYGADGTLLESRGALRVVTLPPQSASPVQLLVINQGVAPAPISLSLRADPPPAAAQPAPQLPGVAPRLPDPATGAEPGAAGQMEPAPDTPADAPADPGAAGGIAQPQP